MDLNLLICLVEGSDGDPWEDDHYGKQLMLRAHTGIAVGKRLR